VVILNTCTVTAEADQDRRQAVRRIHRKNPAAAFLVTGCYARAASRVVKLVCVEVVDATAENTVARLTASMEAQGSKPKEQRLTRYARGSTGTRGR
jgi:threonylcarbamoyladenosine tRNA methylthiotransferase MtaB